MDSVSQLALGAAVGIATMGYRRATTSPRTAIWKAALWGGIAGTLPDLDVFIDHGDPLSNMVKHRAGSHSLIYLSLLSPALAALAWRIHGRTDFKRWWLAIWLALITHPLLDACTVYGTRLLLPFTDHAFGTGSIFIIDPLYTLPLLAGVALALMLRTPRGLRWNAIGISLSSAYLIWGLLIQAHISHLARQSLPEGTAADVPILVTPTAFNTVLWRVLVLDGTRYHEGFHSLFDSESRIHFDSFPSGTALAQRLPPDHPGAALMHFARGFAKLHEREGHVLISDLRMGQEPYYSFSFVIAQAHTDTTQARPVTPRAVGSRGDIHTNLRWVWQRLQGKPLPPPR